MSVSGRAGWQDAGVVNLRSALRRWWPERGGAGHDAPHRRREVPRPGLVRVRGVSMEPTLHDGDLLLVLWGALPRVGGLVVCELPRDDDGVARPLSVKRLTGTDPADATRWWVERDNPRVGVDSWLVGSLEATAIRAAVLTRLPTRPPRGSR